MALGEFTTDGRIWADVVLCEAYVNALQPQLMNTEGVDWVERQQIDLALREMSWASAGLMNNANNLRLGRLVKADGLVLGNFYTRTNEGKFLRLEVIELEHAELLAIRVLPLTSTNQPGTADLNAAAAAIKSSLQEARLTLKENLGRKIIAPLFFKNSDPSPRLDRFEDELAEIMRQEAGREFRVLRFPRAVESQGEMELAWSGLSAGPAEPWKGIADLYIWGTYNELPAFGIPFEKVPVQVTLQAWAGVGKPQVVVGTNVVAELSLLARKLSAQVFEQARTTREVTVTTDARQQLASQILKDVFARKAIMPNNAFKRDSFVASPEGRKLTDCLKHMLAVAAFFNPADREICWERLQLAWPIYPNFHQPFLRQWQLVNDFGEYVLRFGNQDPLAADQYLGSTGLLLFYIQDPHWWPTGVPKEALAQWHELIEAEHVRVLFEQYRAYTNSPTPGEVEVGGIRYENIGPFTEPIRIGFIVHAAMKDIYNAPRAELVFNTFWPSFKPHFDKYCEGKDLPPTVQEIRELMPSFCARIGKPELAAQLLAPRPTSSVYYYVGQAPPVNTNREKPNAAKATNVLDAFEQIRPSMKPLPVPTSLQETLRQNQCQIIGVNAFSWTANALWISVDTGNVYERREKEPLLLRYDPATGILENVSTRLGPHSRISSLLEYGNRLWLTLDADGVWSLDPATCHVRKYGLDDGLLTLHMRRSTILGSHLVFAGSQADKGLINLVATPTLTWGRLDVQNLHRPGSSNSMQPVVRNPIGIDALTGHGPWLLAGSKPWILCNVEKGHAQNLATLLKDAPALKGAFGQLPVLGLRCCAADNFGFWLGNFEALLSFNPQTAQLVRCAHLPKAPTLLFPFQDWIWIACEPEPLPEFNQRVYSQNGNRFWGISASDSAILLYHKPSRTLKGKLLFPGTITAVGQSPRSVFVGFTPKWAAVQRQPQPLPLDRELSCPIIEIPIDSIQEALAKAPVPKS